MSSIMRRRSGLISVIGSSRSRVGCSTQILADQRLPLAAIADRPCRVSGLVQSGGFCEVARGGAVRAIRRDLIEAGLNSPAGRSRYGGCVAGAGGFAGGWAVRIGSGRRDGCARGALPGVGCVLMTRRWPKADTLGGAGSLIDRRPAAPMRTSVVLLDGFAGDGARGS